MAAASWHTQILSRLQNIGRREVPVWYDDSSRVTQEFERVGKRQKLFNLIPNPFPLYDWIMGFHERWSDNDALERIVLEPGQRVLDAGTGTGYFVSQLVARAGGKTLQVTALDRSRQMLLDTSDYLAARDQSSPNINFIQANCCVLPFADGAFDLYASTYLLDLLNDGERQQALAEMLRVLAPNGQAILLTMTTELADFAWLPRLFYHLANELYCWGYEKGRWNRIWRFFCAGYAPHCRPIALGSALAHFPNLVVQATKGSHVSAFPTRIYYLGRAKPEEKGSSCAEIAGRQEMIVDTGGNSFVWPR